MVFCYEAANKILRRLLVEAFLLIPFNSSKSFSSTKISDFFLGGSKPSGK